MDAALLDPEFGYYTKRPKIFNKGGDFTTSPEISQLFGEVGSCSLTHLLRWSALGWPSSLAKYQKTSNARTSPRASIWSK